MIEKQKNTPDWIQQVSELECEFRKIVDDFKSRGCTVVGYPFEISASEGDGKITYKISCSIVPPDIKKISEAISQLRVSTVEKVYYRNPSRIVLAEDGIFSKEEFEPTFKVPFEPTIKVPKAQP